jgi:Leucine-rich repeat (LRR) protein
VAHLAGLEILLLGGTMVSDLSPLAGLPRLHTLGLESTEVRDLGPLIGIGTLERLNLVGNRWLTDIQPLLFNPGLGAGDAVRLERTGVACEDVGALQRRGVTVLNDCS